MCGITGWLNNVSNKIAIDCLLNASSRGCDGFGILVIDSLELIKEAKRFDKGDYIPDLNKKSVLAHFRLHTILNTSNDKKYIQPLKYKHYYISHNGYLKNIQTKESDSLFLLKKIVDNNYMLKNIILNIDHVIKQLKIKQIAISIYDYKRRVFYLYRKDMPLFLSQKHGAFCSKPIDKSFKLIKNKKQEYLING